MDDLLLDLGRHKRCRFPPTLAKKGNADVPTMARAGFATKPNDLPPDSVIAELLPSPWNRTGSVLCIAGRGPFDAAAAAVLAQLLERQGLGARAPCHTMLSRAGTSTRSTSRASPWSVSLTLRSRGRTIAPAVTSCNELRERLPGAKMLVGLYPGEEHRHDEHGRFEAISARTSASPRSEAQWTSALMRLRRPNSKASRFWWAS